MVDIIRLAGKPPSHSSLTILVVVAEQHLLTAIRSLIIIIFIETLNTTFIEFVGNLKMPQISSSVRVN